MPLEASGLGLRSSSYDPTGWSAFLATKMDKNPQFDIRQSSIDIRHSTFDICLREHMI